MPNSAVRTKWPTSCALTSTRAIGLDDLLHRADRLLVTAPWKRSERYDERTFIIDAR